MVSRILVLFVLFFTGLLKLNITNGSLEGTQMMLTCGLFLFFCLLVRGRDQCAKEKV
jgi:hypothetical protein